ncbi:MAG: acetylglutamate kinase [Pseudomonadota bacterium]
MHTEEIRKAGVLVEALPYIRRFRGHKVVIKYGGHAMTEEALKKGFAQDVALLSYVGLKPVVVHGGGPQIGRLLSRLGIESRFAGGLRITDAETMTVVEMVLAGQINKEIVGLMQAAGGRAVGLSGKDGALILARRLQTPPATGTESVDLGYVGEVERVDTTILDTVMDQGFVPVVCPVGGGPDGQSYNINADTAAAEVAIALGASKLVFLTDVAGVRDSDGRLISSLDQSEAERLIGQGHITGGMIPKVRGCCNVVARGVGKVHIIDGRLPHALLLEIFTDKGIGTEVVQ